MLQFSIAEEHVEGKIFTSDVAKQFFSTKKVTGYFELTVNSAPNITKMNPFLISKEKANLEKCKKADLRPY